MSNHTGVFRDGLKLLPQVAAQNATETPDLGSIFTPHSHEGALDPKREVVIGDRGVGKSFWSSVLKDDAARTAISDIYPRLGLEKLSVSLGFSEVIAQQEYPSVRILHALLTEAVAPEFIWRSVIIHKVPAALHPDNWLNMDWAARADWIKKNPEKEEQILAEFNSRLVKSGRSHLFVFDALDRLASDWHSIRILTKALLTVCLELRSFPALRAKLFIRPDMESDREIWSIRDGSKLRQNSVNLKWRTSDLYGFVWHWFLLDPETRAAFVSLCKKKAGIDVNIPPVENLIKVPDALLEDDNIQKGVFETLAGNVMGAGSKKGHPFTWIPKHLADARGRVSLRSFIIALRYAASHTPATASTAISYDQIKLGVQQASLNRVEQLKEDYVWIEDVLEPLSGLETPNKDGEFIKRWKKAKTIHKIFSLKNDDPDCLIPVELEGAKEADKEVYEKLIEALGNIGVTERRDDGRLNVPDLFQVASGMIRRGGVRPIQ